MLIEYNLLIIIFCNILIKLLICNVLICVGAVSSGSMITSTEEITFVDEISFSRIQTPPPLSQIYYSKDLFVRLTRVIRNEVGTIREEIRCYDEK